MTKNRSSGTHPVWIFSHLVLPLALGALESQHQLLSGLGLLPQDGLGLTSESLLLTVVPRIEQF